MTPGGGDGPSIRELFDQLLELDEGGRAVLLQSQPEDIRSTLEGLLGHLDTPGPFDEISGHIATPGQGRVETLPSIERLSGALEERYRLVREIGEGGMAVVYLADDLRHERQVAIKVLKPEIARRIGAERFLTEIKTMAGLQHPHILPLFDSGDADGFLYYVMPYVEEESLRQRLDRAGELSVEDATRMTIDLARALDYAHGRRVVHRDIKPENILLTSGGALVADFGIALLLSDSDDGAARSGHGLRIGTPGYMSPEQRDGSPTIGPPSDVYALGCVLAEMVTGARPSAGGTKPLPRLPGGGLDDVVRKAVADDPSLRYASAGDFAGALDAYLRGRAASPVRILVPALAVAVLLIGFAWTSRTSEDAAPLAVSEPVTFAGNVLVTAISPDGSRLAWIAGSEGGPNTLFVRDLDGDQGEELYRSDENLYHPRWSPDGTSLLFTELASGVPTIWTIGSDGGAMPRTVPSSHVFANFVREGREVVRWTVRNNIMSAVDLESGETTDTLGFTEPFEWLYGVDWSEAQERMVVSAYSEGDAALWTTPLATARIVPRAIHQDSVPLFSPAWGPGGRSISYLRPTTAGNEVWRVDVAEDGRSADNAHPLTDPVPMYIRNGLEPAFTTSADGRLASFTHRLSTSNVRAVSLSPDAEIVEERALTSGTSQSFSPALSPGGDRLAFAQTDARGASIVVLDLETGRQYRLMTWSGSVWSPTWSSDGRSIAFGATEGGSGLWTVNLDGSEPRQVPGVSVPNGNHIAWESIDDFAVQSAADVSYGTFDANGEEVATLAPEGAHLAYDLRPSWTGDWLALWSEHDGVSHLWVLSADGSDQRRLAEGHVPIGWTEDDSAVWAIEGDRLGRSGMIVRVPIDGSEPIPWVELPLPAPARYIDISADGRLIVASVEDTRTDAHIIELPPPG